MGATAANKYASLVDEAEGLDKIEDLQNHEQEEIYDKAANILEAFFDVEDGEVENLAPQVRAGNASSARVCTPRDLADGGLCPGVTFKTGRSTIQQPKRGSFCGLLDWVVAMHEAAG